MPAKQKITTQDQVLNNKKLLKGAEDLSSVNSWFKSWSTESNSKKDTPASKAESEPFSGLVKDDGNDVDEEDFSADSDTGGLEYNKPTTLSSQNPVSRQSLSTNDKLRKQFLGKHAKPGTHQGLVDPTPHANIHQHQHRKSRRVDGDDDNEDGRTKATTSVNTGKGRTRQTMGSGQPAESTSTNPSVNGNKALAKKRKATSYLDEMLAKRGKKKAAREIDD